METIGSIIIDQQQQRTLQQHKPTVTGGWPQPLSRQQKSDADAFMQHFPTVEKLYTNFAPSKCGHCLEHLDECQTYPCITLNMVDRLYNVNGVAQNIVKNHIVGIYKLGSGKEPYDAADMAADRFIGNYGSQCSLYALMIYFGKYDAEFKSCYVSFSLSDILQQFGKKFLPWWRSRMAHVSKPEPERKSDIPEGIDGQRVSFRQRVRNGEDIRKYPIYQMGVWTDSDIERAERECAAGIF